MIKPLLVFRIFKLYQQLAIRSGLLFRDCSLLAILTIHPITSRFTRSTLIFPPMLTCIDRSSWAIWLYQALFYQTSPACMELGNDHPAFYTDLMLFNMLYFTSDFIFVTTCHFFLSILDCSLLYSSIFFPFTPNCLSITLFQRWLNMRS